MTYGIDGAKTITGTRGGSGGPWISTAELMKLQGFTKEDVLYEAVCLSKRQVGRLIGNAASVNTIGRVLEEGLWSAGFVMKRVRFTRRMAALHGQ